MNSPEPSRSQASMASPATTYPAPWMASTGTMPAYLLRNPAPSVPASTVIPSSADSAPNTRPRCESVVLRWNSVISPAIVSAPGRPTTTIPTTAGHTAT